jgi:hypothetical protein
MASGCGGQSAQPSIYLTKQLAFDNPSAYGSAIFLLNIATGLANLK